MKGPETRIGSPRLEVALAFDDGQRRQVAQFLGRHGDLATREELAAFAKHTIDRRLDELPKQLPAAARSTP